jgi:hypothetical protein
MPKPPTPLGAGAFAGAIATIAFYFLGLWPAYQRLPGQVQGAAETVIIAVAVYLAGWLTIVRAPGQTVQLGLTASPLPTVQAEPETTPPT